MAANIDKEKKQLNFHYAFTLPQNQVKEFQVELDPDLNLIKSHHESYPDWTKLTHHQCDNCPLKPEEHPYCPAAVGLVDVIAAFQTSTSFEEVDVQVESKGRTYVKHTSLQKGLSSLIGIYLATSGCPILEKLKPMVQFHLPFATPDETMYRAISMYLVAQYFVHKQGKVPDWELAHLTELYQEIHQVNRGLAKRLRELQQGDANVNALVILDCFAEVTQFSLSKNKLDEIKRIFQVYLACPE